MSNNPLAFHSAFPLRELTTFGVEAYAQNLIVIDSLNDLHKIERPTPSPFLIMGAGSNILFKNDFPGLVLRNSLRGITVAAENKDALELKVGSGESWPQLVEYCVSHNWSGIENLAAIPGTAGAAVVQNIGAYGVEFKECVKNVELFDLFSGEFLTLNAGQCEFGYRSSIFKKMQHHSWFITSVTIALKKQFTPLLKYKDLTEHFAQQRRTAPSLSEVFWAITEIRARKIPNPNLHGNAGSFFKNPEIPESAAKSFTDRFPAAPIFPSRSGYRKLSAAWLIEQCGWKGKTAGRAGVHSGHALILVNLGGAAGSEIAALAAAIQRDVAARFGIVLEPEVLIL